MMTTFVFERWYSRLTVSAYPLVCHQPCTTCNHSSPQIIGDTPFFRLRGAVLVHTSLSHPLALLPFALLIVNPRPEVNLIETCTLFYL